MRRRIADLVADRTRMLAAVGHDLRTPITRLRLRVEFLEAGEVKAALLKDLDHMHRLVEGALAFLKGGAAPVPRGAIDLSALVQTIADEFAELGRPVTAVVPDGRVVVSGRLDALQRALENLFENAVRYGGRADASLLVIGDVVTVEIADDGPGIPPERQAEMLQPFVRGDEARGGVAVADGGLGLGLSITATIAAELGGCLAFDRGLDGRFLVRLTLPLG
jgi:signal transduction histidine kinase